MLVPRSYKYTSAPVAVTSNQKQRGRSSRSTSSSRTPNRSPLPHHSQHTTLTEPWAIPTSTPTNAVSAQRESIPETLSMPDYSRGNSGGRRKRSAHDPDALPPAVAALLAVTAIPPRKPNRYRTLPGRGRRISIEELVKDWKSDESLKSNSGCSPLSILLEDADDDDCDSAFKHGSAPERAFLNQRSLSSDSMPSLDSDQHSILSVGSPSTPGSLRSRPSYQNLKKDRARSLPVSQECSQNHPLVPLSESDEDMPPLLTEKKAISATKQKSSFKSNLTLSLQSLKRAAVESISSLSRAANATPSLSRGAALPIDDMLWSHPFLFPRFSSESRPLMDGIPSQAERRYLNPLPLTFEEQEAPFQQALHAPFLAEIIVDAPTIQMQTYNRGRRRSGVRRNAPNPSSEAGRALLGAEGVRQREVRENPDFLRVVVLEMNMRREGKLEQGRAKIWLPPRAASATSGEKGRIPKRWEGVSAYQTD